MKNVRTEFVRSMAVFALGLATTASLATLRPAIATAETAREACTHDAFKLCSDAIPDVEKTKACLAKNRSSLSPMCKTAFASAGHSHTRGRHRHAFGAVTRK
jgi:hypothetical protein